IVVNLLVFVLGMFIDFFEIAFIVIPILAPVADKMGIDLVWFGVILAMNLQTSFLTPPFGFALFYLRSVAPSKDYDDRITGQRIPAVTTTQIYKGSIAFIVLQLIMVAVVVTNPQLVTGNIDKGAGAINAEDALQQLRDAGREAMDARTDDKPAEEDPMKAMLDALKAEEDKKK
ncbi:MAG: TRAP transporter large permease subunit, partial [Rhodoferax sp.]|nr:TRAP transporter large permease subunit [Rhodoferax sp.]